MGKYHIQSIFAIGLLCLLLTACDVFDAIFPIDESEVKLPESAPYTLEPDMFCEDRHPLQIIESLRSAVENRDGDAFVGLVSPNGLYISLSTSETIHLSIDEVHGFFEDNAIRFWGTNGYTGQSIEGSLAVDMTDFLVDDLLPDNVTIACNDNQDSLSDTSVLYNIIILGRDVDDIRNFYSVMRPAELDLLWGAWGIAFEYWNGVPFISAMTHYIWTP